MQSRGGGGGFGPCLSGQTFSTTILLLCHFGQFCRRVSGKLTVQLARGGGPRLQAAPATAATPPQPLPFPEPLHTAPGKLFGNSNNWSTCSFNTRPDRATGIWWQRALLWDTDTNVAVLARGVARAGQRLGRGGACNNVGVTTAKKNANISGQGIIFKLFLPLSTRTRRRSRRSSARANEGRYTKKKK